MAVAAKVPIMSCIKILHAAAAVLFDSVETDKWNTKHLSSLCRRLVSTAEIFVHLVHGHPLNALVRIDPVNEAFVHGQHLWSSGYIGMHRNLSETTSECVR